MKVNQIINNFYIKCANSVKFLVQSSMASKILLFIIHDLFMWVLMKKKKQKAV